MNKQAKSPEKALRIMATVRRYIYILLGTVDRILGRQADDTLIFCYHSVSDDNWRFSNSFADLRNHIEHLMKRYKPVRLSDVLAHMNGTLRLSEPSFVLTFDDGYKNVLTAVPYLESRGIQPTLFVLSDRNSANLHELDGQRGFLTSEDIESLLSKGWELGSHSATHTDFSKLNDADIAREVSGSKVSLEKEFSVAVRYFAYPKGRYTESIKKSVQKAGYELGLSIDDGHVSLDTDRYTVPRICVDRTHTFDEFKVLASPTVVLFRKLGRKILKNRIP